jgi:acyl-CoA synthetase (AMP-forming)/AMP-acid ligase II/acyl carrier protein
MGIIGFHLTPLVLNIDQYLMPTELFIRRPLLWLTQVSSKQATLICSPNFGYQYYLKRLSDKRPDSLDLSKVRLIYNGAEPICPTICQQFTDRLAPYGLAKTAMFPVYGLAEASLAVAFPPLDQPVKTLKLAKTTALGDPIAPCTEEQPSAIELVCVGSAIQGCQLSIRDSQGTQLPANHIGHIWIKGANVSQGYYQSSHIEPAQNSQGWLDTGDLGFINDQDELFISGRAKDLIIINGQNYYPQDIENLCTRLPAIELNKVAAFGVNNGQQITDHLVIFVLFRADLADFTSIYQSVKQHINEQAGLEVSEVVPIATMPKTTSGKLQRFLLAEQYLAGDYDKVLAQLKALLKQSSTQPETDEYSDIERHLKSICDEVIAGNPVGIQDNIFDLGTSSLKLVQIHERIEEIYPDQIELEDFFDYPTIAELATYLQSKLASSKKLIKN